MFRRALAVFAKAPLVGQVKTRLSSGSAGALTGEQAARLYRSFVLDTLARAQRVPDCNVFLFYTPSEARGRMQELVHELKYGDRLELVPQSAGDLGARMNNGFEALFARGMDSVVVIGADLPTLPASRLTEAFAVLERMPVVLGPGKDGGYYLIGMRAPQPELFANIAWSTPQVMAQTLAQIKRLGLQVECLGPWYDVDTVSDLDRLVMQLKRRPVCGVTGLPAHTIECLRQLRRLE